MYCTNENNEGCRKIMYSNAFFLFVLWYLCVVRHQRSLDGKGGRFSGSASWEEAKPFYKSANCSLNHSNHAWQHASVQYWGTANCFLDSVVHIAVFWIWKLPLRTHCHFNLSPSTHVDFGLPKYKGIKCILQITNQVVLSFPFSDPDIKGKCDNKTCSS